MDTAANISLSRTLEEINRLLESYGIEKAEPVHPSGGEGFLDWVKSLVDASQAAAHRFKKRANLFSKRFYVSERYEMTSPSFVEKTHTPSPQEFDATSRMSHACANPSSIMGLSFQAIATASGNPPS